MKFAIGQTWQDAAGTSYQTIIAITDHRTKPRIVTVNEYGSIFDYDLDGKHAGNHRQYDLVRRIPSDPIMAAVESLKPFEKFNGMDTDANDLSYETDGGYAL